MFGTGAVRALKLHQTSDSADFLEVPTFQILKVESDRRDCKKRSCVHFQMSNALNENMKVCTESMQT